MTTREAILADVARAGVWLEGAHARSRADADDPHACATATLALGIVAELLRTGATRETADAAARAFAALVPPADGDPLVLALVAALGRAPRTEALRTLAAPHPAVQCEPALYEAILYEDGTQLEELCARLELGGIAGGEGAARRELGLALASRAFSAARAPTNAAFAMRLLRIAAGLRLDARVTAEALRFVRRQQRVDGAFGHLPVDTAFAGDLRAAFHLPWTLAAVWTIHDALAPRPLVALALRRRRKEI